MKADPPMLRTTISLALATAAGLFLGRLAILFLLEVVMRDQDPETASWRIAVNVSIPALHSLGAGIALALVCQLRARFDGALAGVLALAVGTLLCISALSGIPFDDPFMVPATDSARGRIAFAAMLVIGSGWTLIAMRLTRQPSWLRYTAPPVACGLLLLLTSLGLRLGFSSRSPERTVRQTVEEIAFEPDRWDIAHQHPRQGPRLSVLTPNAKSGYDGGDLPSLIMPPPCEISFTVPASDEGELFLRASAGADQMAHKRRLTGDPAVRVGFTIEVDGKARFEHQIVIDRDTPDDERIWAHVDGERGLPVRAGQRITLRTEVLEPQATQASRIPVLPIGFGGLFLEREVRRTRQHSSPDAPNLVLIVMDTLRQDALSCYGGTPGSSPHLDALAERGLLFENAFATSSWTWPSTASILTGLPPESHGVEADGSCYLRSTFETLPERLDLRGYTTGAFTCNPLIVADHGFAQGFEDFDDQPGFRFSPTMIDRALDWISMNADSRFFLYVHLVDTHWPYALSDEERAKLNAIRPAELPERGLADWHTQLVQGKGHDANGVPLEEAVPADQLDYMLAEYDAAVRAADHWVGKVLARLHDLGLDDRTIVAFTSDHGEEFLEHGLATHGSQLYSELVRVPLLLAGPGVPVGERSDALVSNRHIAPTLSRFGGAPFETLDDPLDLARPAELPKRPVYYSTHQGWWNGHHRLRIYSVNDGEWSLQWAPEGSPWKVKSSGEGPGEWRLFHIAEDPDERLDLSATETQRAAAMLEQLREHMRQAAKQRPTLTVGIGKNRRKMLEGIGYIGSEEDEEDDVRSTEGGSSPHR